MKQITADDIEVNEREMMWRVYLAKTNEPRRLPIPKLVALIVKNLIGSVPKRFDKLLLRKSRRNPWKPMTGCSVSIGLRKKLGEEFDTQWANGWRNVMQLV